ncbi:hypothetical protein MO867_13510 [Microbulbifer sp. OS29]|uniref:Zinc-ribbon domain-containing protein n=1 Tax=Microbulbifer okhotskensis TaxID=2926617 RepID=A0A9X2EPG3_9GAMM|nr:hypothetical protein [Microbulbifer okhotskensis]MCO1335350.1 hypothetical protein [Microbulbifer okhotskensis]
MLIQCKECSNEYSDQAQACIHCGARNPNKTSTGRKAGVAMLSLLGIAAGLLVLGNLIYDPEKDALQRALIECRKAQDDPLLTTEARRMARTACDEMENKN